jgi:hypothetical protein
MTEQEPTKAATLPAQRLTRNGLEVNHAKSGKLPTPPFARNRGSLLALYQRPSTIVEPRRLVLENLSRPNRGRPPDFSVYRCACERPVKDEIYGKSHKKDTERGKIYGI